MTETKAATTQSQLKMPQLLLSIDAKNEFLYRIKKVSTAIHYVTLIAFGYMYLMDHEYMKPCSVVTVSSFLLAYFVPPTGMIKPDDVPEYAKTSCGWVVNKEEVANRLVEEMKAKKEMETKGKAKKESKKKK